MDKITPERRSWNMSRIRGRDTTPERQVRSLLHRMGYRFSLKRRDLPGNPDIVLPKYKTTIFVHGCFWHRHKGCKMATVPKTHTDFWMHKFDDNVARDHVVQQKLLSDGWHVLIVWQCQVERSPQTVARRLQAALLRIDQEHLNINPG